MQRLSRFLAPKWLALHVFVLAACVTMVFLGRWQLRVSNSKHFDLQNFGYALQWWAFCGFALVMWLRVMRDVLHREADLAIDGQSQSATRAAAADTQPGSYRRYVMPQHSTTAAVAFDGQHAAYNDYLARLAISDLDESPSE